MDRYLIVRWVEFNVRGWKKILDDSDYPIWFPEVKSYKRLYPIVRYHYPKREILPSLIMQDPSLQSEIHKAAQDYKYIKTRLIEYIEGRGPPPLNGGVDYMEDLVDLAIQRSTPQVVKYLIELTVCGNFQCSDQSLTLAVRRGNKELVEMLAESKKWYYVMNEDRQAALQEAQRLGLKEIAEIIRTKSGLE